MSVHAVKRGISIPVLNQSFAALPRLAAEAAGRTPFEMANTAADVDELSAGRTIIGMYASYPVCTFIADYMGCVFHNTLKFFAR